MMHFSGNYLHHLTFPLSHAGVEIDAPALRKPQDFPSKTRAAPTALIFVLRVSWGQTPKIKILTFTQIRGFYQKLCFSKTKLIISENLWKVLEYEVLYGTRDFLWLNTAHDVSLYFLSKTKINIQNFSLKFLSLKFLSSPSWLQIWPRFCRPQKTSFPQPARF